MEETFYLGAGMTRGDQACPQIFRSLQGGQGGRSRMDISFEANGGEQSQDANCKAF